MWGVFSIEPIAGCPRPLMLRLPPVLAPRITLVQGSCALVAPAVTHARTSERMASEPARLLMAGLLGGDGDARAPGANGGGGGSPRGARQTRGSAGWPC